MGLRDRLKRPEAPTGSFATSATPTRADDPAARRGQRRHVPRAQARAAQKLIEKLDLQTIEKLPREQLRDELRLILNSCWRPATCRSTASSASRWSRSCSTRSPASGRWSRCWRDTTISDIMVNGYNICYVERFGKLELTAGPLPRQRAPAADHHPHRVARRPPRRRVVADGRRPPARRRARQRHHPAAGDRRPGAVDPPLRRLAAAGQGHDRHQQRDARDAGVPGARA